MECQSNHLHLVCRDLGKMINFFTKSLDRKFVKYRNFWTADGPVIDLAGTHVLLEVGQEGEGISPRPTRL
jgi:hypothetical protein